MLHAISLVSRDGQSSPVTPSRMSLFSRKSLGILNSYNFGWSAPERYICRTITEFFGRALGFSLNDNSKYIPDLFSGLERKINCLPENSFPVKYSITLLNSTWSQYLSVTERIFSSACKQLAESMSPAKRICLGKTINMFPPMSLIFPLLRQRKK